MRFLTAVLVVTLFASISGAQNLEVKAADIKAYFDSCADCSESPISVAQPKSGASRLAAGSTVPYFTLESTVGEMAFLEGEHTLDVRIKKDYPYPVYIWGRKWVKTGDVLGQPEYLTAEKFPDGRVTALEKEKDFSFATERLSSSRYKPGHQVIYGISLVAADGPLMGLSLGYVETSFFIERVPAAGRRSPYHMDFMIKTSTEEGLILGIFPRGERLSIQLRNSMDSYPIEATSEDGLTIRVPFPYAFRNCMVPVGFKVNIQIPSSKQAITGGFLFLPN